MICAVSYYFIFDVEKTRHIELIKGQVDNIVHSSSEMINDNILRWQPSIKQLTHSHWIQNFFMPPEKANVYPSINL